MTISGSSRLSAFVLLGGLLVPLLACKKSSEPTAEGAAATASATVASAAPSASASAGADAEPSFEDKVKASQPLAPTPEPQPVAGKKLQPSLCKLPAGSLVGKSMSTVIQAVEVVDDRMLAIDTEGVLHGYKLATGAGCEVSVDEAFGKGGTLTLPSKVTHLSRTNDGVVFASSGIFGTHAIKDGELSFSCSARGHLDVEPGGKWGLLSWVNADTQLAELTPSSCRAKPWTLVELGSDAKRKGPFTNINTAAVIGDRLYVGGVLAERVDGRQPRVVAIYNKAGKELGRFGARDKGFGDDAFGWVHGISACGANVCVIDTNFKRLSVWSRDGKSFLGALKMPALVGLKSFWMTDLTQAKDGALYFAIGADREGVKGVAEGLVYRVTGF